jgi:hypothetical protein
VAITDPITTSELRLEVTDCGVETSEVHIAVFGTDPQGQWCLVDDWTPVGRRQLAAAVGELVSLVDAWAGAAGRICLGVAP